MSPTHYLSNGTTRVTKDKFGRITKIIDETLGLHLTYTHDDINKCIYTIDWKKKKPIVIITKIN